MKRIISFTIFFISSFVLRAQNNVGVNTTNPQASLDVRGTQRVGGINNYMKYDSATGRIEWIGAALYAPVSQQIIRHSNSSEGLYAGGGRLEYRNVTGPVFYSDWTNGNGYFRNNLGINNSSPQFPLSFSNDVGEKISFYGTPTNNYGIGLGLGFYKFIQKDLEPIFYLDRSSDSFNEVMRIKGNGNVGIGNNAPMHLNFCLRCGAQDFIVWKFIQQIWLRCSKWRAAYLFDASRVISPLVTLLEIHFLKTFA
jgi:hypothetical protein